VGIPAKSSTTGFRRRLVLSLAYSDKYIADPKPNGTATSNAIPVVQRVPTRSGTTPKLAGTNLGAQRVPVKKSMIGTCRKNSIAGTRSDQTIPIVIKTEKAEALKSVPRITRSPMRGEDWRSEKSSTFFMLRVSLMAMMSALSDWLFWHLGLGYLT
jgi:hypothetical protein